MHIRVRRHACFGQHWPVPGWQWHGGMNNMHRLCSAGVACRPWASWKYRLGPQRMARGLVVWPVLRGRLTCTWLPASKLVSTHERARGYGSITSNDGTPPLMIGAPGSPKMELAFGDLRCNNQRAHRRDVEFLERSKPFCALQRLYSEGLIAPWAPLLDGP